MSSSDIKKAVSAICLLVIAVYGHAQTTVTTTGGTVGYVPKFSGASTVTNSQIYDTGTSVGIGDVPNPGARLDVNGEMIMRGAMQVTRTGNSTTNQGYPSYGFEFFSNVYNSSTKAGDNPYFTLQSEPTGNNTASPSATFNLLFSNNGAASAETGFYINPNGTLHFASAQTFPIAAGPQGPQGPTGPAGPTGPQGPGGTISLPFDAYANGNNQQALFIISAAGSTGGAAIQGVGAPPSGSGPIGGAGLIGSGGTSATSAGIVSQGGNGVRAVGGPALNDQSYAGSGVFAIGGAALPGSHGGDGIETFGGTAPDSNSGGYGIYAQADENGLYAGYFAGDVGITGNLSKSGGSFKIDHPLDPANKYLSHSFVESPDMMNIYNGNVVTDSHGEAVVTMPDYFEALNRDFRYQLTTIGSFSRAMVSAKISDGKFTIRTEEANVEVSWQVTGVRQDAWANAHRIPVDEEKPESERGYYTHPELFGHKGEPSISELKHPRPVIPKRQ